MSNHTTSTQDCVDRHDLRACLLCGIIKSNIRFRTTGCDNCEDYLNLKNRPNRILECTSTNFSGIVALMKPEESWVARRCRFENNIRGTYALQISGRLPGYIQDQLLEKGIRYTPRDGTKQDGTELN